MKKGTFVTFEGCEGVGKSTQLRFLREYLEKTEQPALFTREPGGSHISEQVRAILLNPENKDMHPLTEAYLYAAARSQHMQEIILPALERGELVICDRFIDSSLAYQGCARGLGFDVVREINARALDGVMPDITLFLDLSPSHAFRSKAKSEALHDRLEQETADFHQKVYEGFCALAQAEPERYVRILPEIEKEATAQKVVDALKVRGVIR